jgi:hypothetical protein
MMRISSWSEKPVRHHARRLADWINPTGSRKVHSLVDKVYKRGEIGLVNLIALIPSLAPAR